MFAQVSFGCKHLLMYRVKLRRKHHVRNCARILFLSELFSSPVIPPTISISKRFV